MNTVTERLISFTERVLTHRKRSKYIKKEKQKMLHPVIDWVGAFIWAAGVVLLLNQYLFQAYVIPSGSMEDTLLIKDRLFVNKFIYGPELLPGIGKLPGFKEPTRSEIIIFENPEYKSRGTLFDLTQRIVFMLTLSMVDLDKDESGNPAVHFLIKRSISGYDDIVTFTDGELYLKPEGEKDFIHEEEFKNNSDLTYYSQRLINKDYYAEAEDYYKSNIFQGKIEVVNTPYQKVANNKVQYDGYHWRKTAGKYLSQFNPGYQDAYRLYNRFANGIYVPDGWILPIGDNRDNSNDGRYFGPVRKSEILGQASFKFWPINRIGLIK